MKPTTIPMRITVACNYGDKGRVIHVQPNEVNLLRWRGVAELIPSDCEPEPTGPSSEPPIERAVLPNRAERRRGRPRRGGLEA